MAISATLPANISSPLTNLDERSKDITAGSAMTEFTYTPSFRPIGEGHFLLGASRCQVVSLDETELGADESGSRGTSRPRGSGISLK